MIFLRLFSGCLLQLIPFAILSFYPFRYHLKFGSKKTTFITVGLLVALCLIFSLTCIHLSSLISDVHKLFLCSNLVFMCCLIPCFVWYLFAVEGIWQKKLFSFFFTITAALAMTSIENAVDTWMELNVVIDGLPYYGRCLITLSLLTLITLPLLWLLLKNMYLPIADGLSHKETNSVCIISVVLFAVLASVFIPLEYSKIYNPVSMYLFFALMVTVFVIYIVCFKLLKMSHEKLATYERMIQIKHQLQMLDEQYNRIQDKIEISKKTRHDIRHHFVALQGLLKSGDINGAEKYLERYVEDLEKNSIPNFCENTVLNTVVGYYMQLAKEQNIKFNANINIDRPLNVQDEDFAVLLGNLLDNSISAASKEDNEERFIKMNIMVSGNMLVVAVDNGFNGKIKKKDERYLSLKETHIGYGLASIKNIADKYDGGVEFTNESNVFHASVMLNLE